MSGSGAQQCGSRSRPAVAIYRQDFLRLSETFIADHIETLADWIPVPVCETLRSDGIMPPHHPAHCLQSSPHRAGRRVQGALLARLGSSREFDRLVRDHGIRLIHAHFLTDGVRIMRYAARRRLPLVVTAHGYDAATYDEEWARSRNGRSFLKERARLFRQAAAILCVSNFIRNELLERGAPPEKLIFRPLGVDLAQFGGSKTPPSRRRGLLFAGRLVEKKGCKRLIDAWRGLPQALRQAGLTIIGDGPEGPALRELARANPEIRFLGAQPRSALLAAMAEHRAFALPSLRATTGDSEGMPIVAMEAQALGTPVIAFDAGPMREVLAPGESGLVVEAGDPGALREAIRRLLEDDELADRFGACAPGIVAQRFDLRRNTAAIEEVYAQVVERAGRS